MTGLYKINFFSLLLLVSTQGFAQSNQLFFHSTAIEEGSQCYEIILRSTDTGGALLSSQNFRMYYDASVLRFDRLKSLSLLPSAGYGEIKVMQAVHNSNALGFGGLEFAANLGYVNLAINDRRDKANLLPIPKDMDLAMASICFEVVDATGDPTLVWARYPLTSGYSSAFTEVALYKNGVLSILKDLEFQDIDASWTSHPEKMVDLGTTRNKR